MKPRGGLSLKGRALQWLAQREHSRLEMRRKLLPLAALEAAQAVPELQGDASSPALPDASRQAPLPGRAATRSRRGGSAGAGGGPETAPRRPAFAIRRHDDGDGEPATAALDADEITAAEQPAGAVFHGRTSERRATVTPEVEQSVDELLDWLEAKAYLSDARFVDSRVRARESRLGMQRIRQELSRHGARLSAEATEALKASEAARAAAVWQRKFGEPAVDPAGRARQMRFLAARGFDPDVIRRVVPAARRDAGVEPDEE